MNRWVLAGLCLYVFVVVVGTYRSGFHSGYRQALKDVQAAEPQQGERIIPDVPPPVEHRAGFQVCVSADDWNTAMRDVYEHARKECNR